MHIGTHPGATYLEAMAEARRAYWDAAAALAAAQDWFRGMAALPEPNRFALRELDAHIEVLADRVDVAAGRFYTAQDAAHLAGAVSGTEILL